MFRCAYIVRSQTHEETDLLRQRLNTVIESFVIIVVSFKGNIMQNLLFKQINAFSCILGVSRSA